MSKRVSYKFTCGRCSTESDVEMYRSIWGEIPENRELVFSNHINRVTCPKCHSSFKPPLSLLYTNSRLYFAVWYEPENDPAIDRDNVGYRAFSKQRGPGYSQFEHAPRVRDWEEFKNTIRRFEVGELVSDAKRFRDREELDGRNKKRSTRLFKRPILGLFKRNLEELDDFAVMMLTHSAVSNGFALAETLTFETPEPSALILMQLAREALSFELCLAQMVIQKRFSIRDPEALLPIVQRLIDQLSEFPDRPVPEGELAVNLQMLKDINVFKDDFFKQTLYYMARDYSSLGIPENDFRAFCSRIGLSASVLHGAGWTLALTIFEFRVSSMLLRHDQFSSELPKVRRLCYQGCTMAMATFDRILDQY